MRQLTIEEAQALMAIGTFMAHQSEPGAGYKRTTVGNIETHDGRTLNSAEFWYARRNSAFHQGWIIFELTADKSNPASCDLLIRCNAADTHTILDSLMVSVAQCKIVLRTSSDHGRSPTRGPSEITVVDASEDAAFLIEHLLTQMNCSFVATYQGAEFYKLDPYSGQLLRLRRTTERLLSGAKTLRQALEALANSTAI